MRHAVLTILLALLWLAVPLPTGQVYQAHADEVPTSARSRAVRERIEPALKQKLQDQGLKLGAPVFLRIFKESRELEFWLQKGDTFGLFHTYRICTFSGRLGPKQQRGDNQSPEGFYFVPPGRMNPYSNFHLSFDLGYPNAFDRAHGRTGNYLMVHGNCVSIGCYAMTDPFIEEIYTIAAAALSGGQPYFRAHVFPFRLTEENLQRHADSPWLDFWRNLKTGYDLFETTKIPPNVEVRERMYVFGGD